MKQSPITGSLAAIVVLVGLVGCGQSASDKAASQVCDARADIEKQVATLKGMTPTSASAEAISNSLKAIRADYQKIADAQSDLNAARKSDVQAANEAFTSQLQEVAKNLPQTASTTAAQQQVSASLSELADTYRKALAKVSCP